MGRRQIPLPLCSAKLRSPSNVLQYLAAIVNVLSEQRCQPAHRFLSLSLIVLVALFLSLDCHLGCHRSVAVSHA